MEGDIDVNEIAKKKALKAGAYTRPLFGATEALSMEQGVHRGIV